MRYAYLAIGCGILGTIITLVVVLACQYLGVDIPSHLWVLAIPITVSLVVNIGLVELYDRYHRRK